LIVVDGAETPPTKKFKPSLPACSSGENSLNQNPSCPLANSTLLQKSM